MFHPNKHTLMLTESTAVNWMECMKKVFKAHLCGKYCAECGLGTSIWCGGDESMGVFG